MERGIGYPIGRWLTSQRW